MKALIPFVGIGVALAFVYMTFEPVVADYLYLPLYEAIWAGLGIGGAMALTCAVLCAAGLYAFLAVTKPHGMKLGERR